MTGGQLANGNKSIDVGFSPCSSGRFGAQNDDPNRLAAAAAAPRGREKLVGCWISVVIRGEDNHNGPRPPTAPLLQDGEQGFAAINC